MLENNINKPFKNALFLNTNWNKTLNDLRNKKIIFISDPKEKQVTIGTISGDNEKIQLLEKSLTCDLNPENGLSILKNYNVEAYDESIQKVDALSGSVYFTCHTLVRLNIDDYAPICELTANYITRSEETVKKSEVFTLAKTTTGAKYNENYSEERTHFLRTHVSHNTILIIDGPLVGKQLSSRTIRLVKELEANGVLSFFVTKNSDSLLLAGTISPKVYHSDLHWASENLKAGQRSTFVKYVDQTVGHTEIFCYLKTYEVASPLRVSFYPTVYSNYPDIVNKVLDMLYYLVLDDGDLKNPQVRLVRVAELFSKDIMKIANPYGQVMRMGLVLTVNQSRFGRSI